MTVDESRDIVIFDINGGNDNSKIQNGLKNTLRDTEQ